MKAEFAPSYSRTDDGLVIFPRSDAPLRSQFFTYTDSTDHIARCNMFMIKELVEFLSEPGETICDPFAGTGTILVAADMGRKVVCIEIEEHFQDIIQRNIDSMVRWKQEVDDLVTLVPGDCYKILPVPEFANHFMFSPPWAQVLRKKSVDQFTKDAGYGTAELYTQSPDNVGNLPDFFYHQKMEQIYRKIFQSLVPGGTLTIIIKDRMEKGKRIRLGERAQKDCIRMGFEPLCWNKWNAIGGGFAAYNRSIGLETVDEEDLITLRRP